MLVLEIICKNHVCNERISAVLDSGKIHQIGRHPCHAVSMNRELRAIKSIVQPFRCNVSKIRVMAIEARSQQNHVLIGDICHMPVPCYLRSLFIAPSRGAPKGLPFVLDEPQGTADVRS